MTATREHQPPLPDIESAAGAEPDPGVGVLDREPVDHAQRARGVAGARAGHRASTLRRRGESLRTPTSGCGFPAPTFVYGGRDRVLTRLVDTAASATGAAQAAALRARPGDGPELGGTVASLATGQTFVRRPGTWWQRTP